MSEEFAGGRLSGGQPFPGDGERIVCIIARDVLPLDKSHADTSELVRVIWGARWLILSFIAGFGLLSVAYALLATEWYQAEVVLTPTGSKDRQGLASALGKSRAALEHWRESPASVWAPRPRPSRSAYSGHISLRASSSRTRGYYTSFLTASGTQKLDVGRSAIQKSSLTFGTQSDTSRDGF